jgi:AcrR family transcriptional regulator
MNLSTLKTKSETTKEKIFKAAAKLFSEKGYNGVSMREISEFTGLSKPAIYYYFGSKEGIYSELVNAGMKVGIKEYEEIFQKNISVKQKLTELMKVRFQQVHRYPELVKFFLSLFNSTENLTFLEHFRQVAKENRQMLSELILEGVTSGEFGASARPELACDIYIGALTHFLWSQLNSSNIILSDQLAEEIVELLFKGLNE